MMLNEREDKKRCKYRDYKRSHLFITFFMHKLLITDKGYKYKNVHRWSKSFDIFEMDKIFFPINIDNIHWTMAVVYIQLKEIHYYDSMSGDGMQWLESLRQWLVDEAKEKKNIDLDTSEWSLVDRKAHVPQQDNGCDCGVFATICADFLSDDLPLDYKQDDIPFFREKIAADILRGRLLYDI